MARFGSFCRVNHEAVLLQPLFCHGDREDAAHPVLQAAIGIKHQGVAGVNEKQQHCTPPGARFFMVQRVTFTKSPGQREESRPAALEEVGGIIIVRIQHASCERVQQLCPRGRNPDDVQEPVALRGEYKTKEFLLQGHLLLDTTWHVSNKYDLAI